MKKNLNIQSIKNNLDSSPFFSKNENLNKKDSLLEEEVTRQPINLPRNLGAEVPSKVDSKEPDYKGTDLGSNLGVQVDNKESENLDDNLDRKEDADENSVTYKNLNTRIRLDQYFLMEKIKLERKIKNKSTTIEKIIQEALDFYLKTNAH